MTATITHISGAPLDVANIRPEDMPAVLATLLAQNAKLQAKVDNAANRKVSLKITVANDKTGSKGGAVSMYGLGRFPVTLYQSQWRKLLEAKDDVLAFIADNADRLAVKD